jgi:hypothetical protein
MNAKEIRKLQQPEPFTPAEHYDGSGSEAALGFWLSEIAAQFAEQNDSLRELRAHLEILIRVVDPSGISNLLLRKQSELEEIRGDAQGPTT